MRRVLLLNSLSGSVLAAAYTAVAFIMAPVIVKAIGNQNYGTWDILQSIVGYLGVLDLGISPAVVRYVAVARGRRDTGETDRVVVSASILLSAVGAIGFLCMALLALSPGLVLNLPAEGARGLWIVFLLVGVNVLVEVPGAAIVGYLFGTQQHYFLNSLRLASMLLSATLVYTALNHDAGRGLVWMASITFGMNVLQYSVLAARVLWGGTGVRFLWSAFSWTLAREMYHFGARSLLLLVAARLRRQSIPIVIAHTIGLDRVVYFTIPNRLVESGWSLGAALGAPLTPYLSHLHGTGDRDGARRAWLGAARALQFCLLGLATGLIGLGGPFIARWMGREYAESGSWALILLALGAGLEGHAAGAAPLLISRGKHGPLARYSLIVALLSVAAAIPATSILGIAGAAGVFMLGAAAISRRAVDLACREVGISVSEHFRATSRRLMMPLAAMAGTLLAARTWVPLDSYPSIVTSAVAASITYAAVAASWSLDREERTALARRLRGLLQGVRSRGEAGGGSAGE